MTALVDDLGVWVQLGTLTPRWDWESFPVSSSTANSIFRVSTIGNFSQINTFIYVRVVYQNSGTNNPDSRWVKFYPKNEKEIIDLNTNPLFTFSNVSRIIQVRKGSRFGGYKRPITDTIYQLKLEEFVPFDNVINNASNLPALQQAIDDSLLQLQADLTQDIVNQINTNIQVQLNNINQQLDDITILLSGVS